MGTENAAHPGEAATPRDNHLRWWQQGHSYALATLVGMNIGVDQAAFRPEIGTGMIYTWAGFLLGQTLLMGIWLAFGGLNAVLRLLVVFTITAAGALVASVSAVGRGPGDILDLFEVLAPAAATIVLAAGAGLLPLRWLLNWRLDFDPAYYRTKVDRRLQLRLVDCLGLMTAWALPCAMARLANREALLFAAIASGFAFFSATPIILLIVSSRRPRSVWFLATAAVGVSLLAEYALTDLGFFGQSFGDEAGLLLPFHLGLFLAVSLNLIPLRRFFGLHLFSIARREQLDPANDKPLLQHDPALATVASAWPTLPQTVRNQIIALANTGTDEPSTEENH